MGKRSAAVTVLAALLGLLSLGEGRPALADIPNVVYNPATGHYYTWIATYTTWANAKTGAEGLGGYLATITSAAEQSWLQSNVIPAGQTSHLGGTDESVEGTWVWITGEPWSYTNWNGGEPNNVGNEDYLAWNSNTTWNDIVGTSGGTNGYVVEWNVNPNIPPPPAAPSGLAGSTAPAQPVLLTWNDLSGNEDRFELERRTPITAYAKIASPPANATSHSDGSAQAETEYTYRIRAVNLGGPSAWSNEFTIATPEFPSSPSAPSDVAPTVEAAGTVRITWTDNSDNEIAFEVHRRVPGGAYAFLADLDPDVTEYTDSGLPPDSVFQYGVRAVNANGASGFGEAEATTLPTLLLTMVRGDLKDSATFGKDSLSAWAEFLFAEQGSDGLLDPVSEGLTLRAGMDAAPVVVSLPPYAEGWKVKGTKAVWKSPKGTFPKYKIEVDAGTGIAKVSVKGFELEAPPANPMRFSLRVGDDGGTDRGDWVPMKKPGVFKLRQGS